MAQDEAAPAVDEALADREQAISSILRELRGDPASDAAADEQATESGPLPGAPQSPAAEPSGGEQDGAAPAVAGPPAGDPSETPAPRQRQAALAGPRPGPQAPTVRQNTLILLHACLLAVFVVGTWLTYRQVSSTLRAITADVRQGSMVAVPLAARGPSQTPESHGPAAVPVPPAPLADPLLRIDESERYAQELEKADLLFEKEEYDAAAAAYRRALAVPAASSADGAAAFRLGECYARLKDYPRAVAAYSQAVATQAGPFQARALFGLGMAHLELRAYGKAREAFYALLRCRAGYGPEADPLIEQATYRVADSYWLEAEALARREGGGQ